MKNRTNSSQFGGQAFDKIGQWHIAAGRQDEVAELILGEGTWREEPWYVHAEATFANAWLQRDVPITLGASQRTLEALRTVADKGGSRSARVAAAACLKDTDVELAMRVLKAEYADFPIGEDEHQTTSDRLAAMGVRTLDLWPGS